jgi:hypothetical protein
MIDLDGNLRLAFDDVEIGDEESVLVDEPTRAQPAGRPDLHHGFAQLIDQISDVFFRPSPAACLIKTRTRHRQCHRLSLPQLVDFFSLVDGLATSGGSPEMILSPHSWG